MILINIKKKGEYIKWQRKKEMNMMSTICLKKKSKSIMTSIYSRSRRGAELAGAHIQPARMDVPCLTINM